MRHDGEVLSGSPLDYPTWSTWAYSMPELGLLTLSEVNERLMLEYAIGRAYGLNGEIARRCKPS
jgi:hypothetical protein